MRGFKDEFGVGVSWHSVSIVAKCKQMALDSVDSVAANNPVNN